VNGEALEAFHEALLDDDAQRLYDLAPCGYLSTTPDGTIIKVNQTFLALTGYTDTQLVDRRTFAELLTPGGRIYHETHYAPLLAMHGSVRGIALDLVRADGTRLPVFVNSVLGEATADRPSVVRTAVFDATDRREYERELLRAKQRAEESEERALTLARTLQQTFIPPTPPAIPGLDVAAIYRPAGTGGEVGGDFYDVFQIADDNWVLTIGDVCGKGADAAVVTALARYTLRASMVQTRDAGRALLAVNDMLLRSGSDRFCTMLVVRLRRRSAQWTVQVSAAGHPLPLLLSDANPPIPLGEPGSLLGVLDVPEFREAERVLAGGEALVLYTDGVTEGRRDLEFFGEARLAASVLAHCESADGLANAIVNDVLDFQSGISRDDIAVVVVRNPHSHSPGSVSR
jgi:sigma-B regulation protein RsbU (phosphoserine phosphatase)